VEVPLFHQFTTFSGQCFQAGFQNSAYSINLWCGLAGFVTENLSQPEAGQEAVTFLVTRMGQHLKSGDCLDLQQKRSTR
jgi:hypothetical protein